MLWFDMTLNQAEVSREVVGRWDRVFNALTAEPRRQLITSLRDAPSDRELTLPEAAMSPRVPMDDAEIRCELLHRHLPLLEDGGFVRWDRDPLRARRGPAFDEVSTVFGALYESVDDLPDRLVTGCDRLERERRERAVE